MHLVKLAGVPVLVNEVKVARDATDEKEHSFEMEIPLQASGVVINGTFYPLHEQQRNERIFRYRGPEAYIHFV